MLGRHLRCRRRLLGIVSVLVFLMEAMGTVVWKAIVPCRTAREESSPAIELQNAWRESYL